MLDGTDRKELSVMIQPRSLRKEKYMKRYIWTPQVLIDNLKKLGEGLLILALFLALSICPAAWV